MNELRERLNKYKEENGCTYQFIAYSTGISRSSISRFSRNERELKHKNLLLNLDDFLKSKGY